MRAIASVPLALVICLGGGAGLPAAARAEPRAAVQQQAAPPARFAALAARVKAAAAAERAAVARVMPDVSQAPAGAWDQVLDARRATRAARDALLAALWADPILRAEGPDAALAALGPAAEGLDQARRTLDEARTGGGVLRTQPLQDWDRAAAAMAQSMDQLLTYIASGGRLRWADPAVAAGPAEPTPAFGLGRGALLQGAAGLVATLVAAGLWLKRDMVHDRHQGHGSRRKPCDEAAMLILSYGRKRPGRMVNVSDRGAALRLAGTAPMPRPRARVTLSLASTGRLRCRVVACQDRLVRLRFDALRPREDAALHALLASLPTPPRAG